MVVIDAEHMKNFYYYYYYYYYHYYYYHYHYSPDWLDQFDANLATSSYNNLSPPPPP